MAEQDSFYVEDTDEEDSLSPQETRHEVEDSFIIPDSDDEFVEGNSSDETGGRMTPSIKKAIRRSIFNISQHVSDSDEEEEEEDEEDAEADEDPRNEGSLERSREVDTSNSDEEFIPSQKRKLHRIESSDDDTPSKPRHEVSTKNDQKSSHSRMSHLLDTSSEEQEKSFGKSTRRSTNLVTSAMDSASDAEDDPDSGRGSNPKDRSSRHGKNRKFTPRTSGSLIESPRYSKKFDDSNSFNIENPSSDEESRIETIKPKKPEIRPSYIASSDEESQSKNSKEIISIDSDTPSDSDPQRGQNQSLGEATALSFAQQELGVNNVDPLLAQRRALLAIELQTKETELAKMMTFIDSGKIQFLPDKGQKLLDRAAETKAQVHHIRKQLSECRLVEQDYRRSPKSGASSSPEPAPFALSPSPLREPKPRRPRDPEYIPSDSEEEVPTRDPISRFLNRPTTAPMGDLGKKALETFEREQALTVETLKTFHGSLNSRPGEDEQAEDPRGLKVSLMAHQKHALAWMTWRERQSPPGGVLADDMGLGKTLTMISLVLKSMDSDDSGGESENEWRSKQKSLKPSGGTLVVCPASLIGQWQEEVKRRCKSGLLNVELYHGNKRESIPKRLARNDMVITTYNLLSREHKVNGVLFRVAWKRVILDEGHVIRNHKSQVCEAVCALEARARWVLTGTPIHNKEMDLFSVLKFLKCSPFDDIRVWKRWVDNKNQAGHDRLATVMKTLMLRRTKQELMNSGAVESLPEKTFEIKWVQLDPEERVVYEKVMLYSKTIFAQFLHQRAEKEQMFRLGAGYYDKPLEMSKNPFNKAQQKLLAQHADVKSHQILTLFLRLRQICCHPSLIDAMLDQEDIEQSGLEDLGTEGLTQKMAGMRINMENEELPDGPAEVDDRVSEHLLTSENPVFERSRESSKLRAVLQLLEEIMEMDEKVIIVSQWTSVLDIIAENLRKIKKATFKSLTGAVMVKDRGAIVDSFNHERNPRVLLLSLTAGGVGLNLVGANHLMLVDIHWNPQLESQAQDRIYRFGQKKNVFIYKFLCQDTIEEKIKNMQDDKLELAQNVLSGGGKAKAAKLTMDDLRSIFGL